MLTFPRSDMRARYAVMMSSAIASVLGLSVQTRSAQAEPASIVDPVLAADDLRWAGSDDRYERWIRKRAKRFSRTREYKRSTGLSQIDAAMGYARIMGKKGGKGVKIAIAAGGIDASHPDLKIKRRSETIPGAVDAESTAVAGIIGARRNGRGIHGVAYKSKLIDLQGGGFLAVLAGACITSVEERKQLIGFPFVAGDGFHRRSGGVSCEIEPRSGQWFCRRRAACRGTGPRDGAG